MKYFAACILFMHRMIGNLICKAIITSCIEDILIFQDHTIKQRRKLSGKNTTQPRTRGGKESIIITRLLKHAGLNTGLTKGGIKCQIVVGRNEKSS